MHNRKRLVAVLVAIAIGPRTAVCGEVLLQKDGRVVLVRQLSEQQVIGHVFGSGPITIAAARVSAEDALGFHIDTVSHIATLTDTQIAKLELAGQGDIDRFLDDVERVLRAAPNGPTSVQELEQLWRDIQSLQVQFRAGLHGPDSLFRKTFRSTLDVEQLSVLQEVERTYYRELVQLIVLQIDEEVLHLSPKQREEFVELVVEKTEPLPYSATVVWRDGNTSVNPQPILQQMSKIERDLEPLFNKKQWGQLQQVLQRGGELAPRPRRWSS